MKKILFIFLLLFFGFFIKEEAFAGYRIEGDYQIHDRYQRIPAGPLISSPFHINLSGEIKNDWAPECGVGTNCEIYSLVFVTGTVLEDGSTKKECFIREMPGSSDNGDINADFSLPEEDYLQVYLIGIVREGNDDLECQEYEDVENKHILILEKKLESTDEREIYEVIFTIDNTRPEITLNGSSTVEVIVGENYVDAGATAWDNTDGDITANIVASSTSVNTAIIGPYSVTYNVSDTAGNQAAEAVRTVNVIPVPSTTITAEDLSSLLTSGALVPTGGDPNDAPSFTAVKDITINVPAGSGTSQIILPYNTIIAAIDGTNFDGSLLTAADAINDPLANLSSGIVLNGALQWGIADLGLQFSESITLKIYVGTEHNGKILEIVRSISGTDSWTSDGLVAPPTCLVAGGLCVFQATKASYYAATSPTSVVISAPPATAGGGGGSPEIGNNASIAQIGLPSPPSSLPAARAPEASQGRVLGAQTLANGALIRAKGGIDVYVVKNIPSTSPGQADKQFKYLILNPKVFNSYGYKWENVLDVEPETLDSYITSALVHLTNSPKVYQLYPADDSGAKRWIKTEQVFNNLNFDWNAVFEINLADFNSYQTGATLE